MTYAKSLASGNLMNALDPQYQKALTLLRVVPVLAHLGYSLEQFQDTMLQFAESLNTAEQERSPSGYAASFGDFFSSNPSLSEEDGSWMSLTNASVQYVPAIQPGSNTPQLVKRMHYVSFVGMFRSDLFEGLCVGHAPKKCPICRRWFLTTNARHTKYCGNLAPGISSIELAARLETCKEGHNVNLLMTILSSRFMNAAVTPLTGMSSVGLSMLTLPNV